MPSPIPENRYKATWAHQARFACGCATLLFSLAKLMLLISRTPFAPRTSIELTLAAVLGYLLADLASGVVHWAFDNYGGAGTPFVGPQIEAFLRHHSHPAEIARCDTARHANTLAAAAAAAMAPLNLFCGDRPALLAFAVVFASCGVFSPKFHAWAHAPRRDLPRLVVALQSAGVLLGPSRHAPHHRPPYGGSYCTMSGVWNRALDESRVLPWAEKVVFDLTGVRPRSWPVPGQ